MSSELETLSPIAVTDDAVFHGALRLRQHRKGYRFTEDAVLLAWFACRGGAVELAADLGAGCGVVGLMLLHRGGARRVIAVELQPGLVDLSLFNAAANNMSERLLPLRADLRALPLPEGSLDLIVSNPPYMKAGTGKLPPQPERALARHEIACSPEELAREAARCLQPTGRLALVYPALRLDQVVEAMAGAGLTHSRSRLVRPRPGAEPGLVLVEASRDEVPRELIEEEPLVTRDKEGILTVEMSAILAGQF
jgi:tRNA1Val (adenine37-N6)-methyltransferase